MKTCLYVDETFIIAPGIVQRRCIGDGKWKEYVRCFREEAKLLLDKV